MIRPLKLAHTSDVHLHDGDGPERAAFARVVDAVIDSQADLFLIAGDLFDHNRIKGDVVDFVYGQLARVDCPTVIIAGNHDCFEERAILRDMDFGRAGGHVHLLRELEGRSIEFPELHATVWGRSMVEHAETNKPLEGAPARRGNLWHIGMAHGLYVDYPNSGRSSLITPEEIAATGFDYLALGHVHVHGQMRHGNTLACYPGAPVPYGTGRHPSCLTLVDLTPGEETVATQVELPTAQDAVSA
jgi:DNA repair exonuclease SbcCD nuclease subunit